MNLDDASWFPDLLRRHRRAAGLTQERLAERAGLSRRGVQDLERGLRRPFPDTVRRLAEALELSAGDREAFVSVARSPRSPNRDVPTTDRARRWAPLPIPATSFIGRERDVAEVKRLLSAARLLTLTGTGGVGKTRLALRVASDLADVYEHGVFVAPLASVGEPELVVPTILHALGMRGIGARPPADVLAELLRDRHILLVLDNFEHLLPAAVAIADLLAGCPRLCVLATSRAALRIQGEQELGVPPMDLPDRDGAMSLAQLSECESIRLFVERARKVRPDFALRDDNAEPIAAICHQLDGLPLAIELAAARVSLLPPRALLARMTARLPLLNVGPRDAPARHQTLRAAIAWSYDLLAPAEQSLFQRLAVFVGGCTLDAAEAVCAPPEVASLVDRTEHPNRTDIEPQPSVLDAAASLVMHHLLQSDETASGNVRLAMLQTVREYASERLVMCGEAEVLGPRHAHYYLALAEMAEPYLRGAEQVTWLDRLELERDNLRAVLRWTIERQDVELGLRLAGALWSFWLFRGSTREGPVWLDQLLSLPEVQEARRDEGGRYPKALAKALFTAGWLVGYLGDDAAACALQDEALAVARKAGDVRGTAFALLGLGFSHMEDLATRLALYEQSLEAFRSIGDRWGMLEARSSMLNFLGNYSVARLAASHGGIAWVRAQLEETLADARAVGDRWILTYTLANLGRVVGSEGNYVRARALLTEAHATARELGDRWAMAYALCRLGCVARDQGALAEAVSLLEESDALMRETSGTFGVALVVSYRALAACDQRDLGAARRFFVEGLALWRALGVGTEATWVLAGVARLAAAEGRAVRAAHMAGAAAALGEAVGMPLPAMEQARLERDLERAREALGARDFAVAWLAGRGLSLEWAITEALDG